MSDALVRSTRVAAAAVLASLLLPPHPAAASCAEGAGPRGQPVVFVGAAEGERRGYTRFAVQEVWAGPDLAPEVWVQSGQEQPPWPLSLLSAVSSSADAEFVEGERYVVGASRSFDTGACSVAEATDDQRAGARTPVADGAVGADPPTGPVGQALWAVRSAGVVAGGVSWLRRRRTA